MIADALLARGLDVEHVMSGTHRQKHSLRPFAVVKGKRVTYPAEAASEPSPPAKIRT